MGSTPGKLFTHVCPFHQAAQAYELHHYFTNDCGHYNLLSITYAARWPGVFVVLPWSTAASVLGGRRRGDADAGSLGVDWEVSQADECDNNMAEPDMAWPSR